MKWYSADIGTWDSGIVVRFKEKSDQHAIRRGNRLAGRLSQVVRATRKVDDCYLVQLHRGRRGREHLTCIFDYLNGNTTYLRKSQKPDET